MEYSTIIVIYRLYRLAATFCPHSSQNLSLSARDFLAVGFAIDLEGDIRARSTNDGDCCGSATADGGGG